MQFKQWNKIQKNEFRNFLKEYKIEILNDEDLNYFEQAFTHQSYAHENKLNYNYQKLEFLGDALIEKEVSLYLFNKQNLNEGNMTTYRKNMVCHATLSKIAKNLRFERFILVGSSYNLNEISAKNYEDTFEAFCAALFLTFGNESLKYFIEKTIIYYFENNLLNIQIDYKTKFQEIMQRFGKHDIKYITTETKNKNNHTFSTKVICDGIMYGNAIASKKHESENLAAKNALEKCATNN